MNYYKDLRLDELGITSLEEAEEMELELDVRFREFTPDDRMTWLRQNAYLEHYARTRTATTSARKAGVSVSAAKAWKRNDTLGFTLRLEISELEFSDRLQELALERASDPKAPATLLIELLRAYIPEKFSRNGHKCDTSKSDEILHRLREDAQREKAAGYPGLRAMVQRNAEQSVVDLAPTRGESSHSNLSPIAEETSQSDLSPGGRKPYHSDLVPAGRDTSKSDLSPGGRKPYHSDLVPAGRDTSKSDLSPGGRKPYHSDLVPAGRDTSKSDLSPGGGETQRGGSSHVSPYDAEEAPTHDRPSPTRHTGGGTSPRTPIRGRYPETAPTSEPNHFQDISSSPDTPEDPYHDDYHAEAVRPENYPPFDTEEDLAFFDLTHDGQEPSHPDLSPAGRDTSHSNLAPTGQEPSHSDLSPTGRDTSHSDLSPAGGETQRGGSSPTNNYDHVPSEKPPNRASPILFQKARPRAGSHKPDTFPVVRF